MTNPFLLIMSKSRSNDVPSVVRKSPLMTAFAPAASAASPSSSYLPLPAASLIMTLGMTNLYTAMVLTYSSSVRGVLS